MTELMLPLKPVAIVFCSLIFLLVAIVVGAFLWGAYQHAKESASMPRKPPFVREREDGK